MQSVERVNRGVILGDFWPHAGKSRIAGKVSDPFVKKLSF